MKYKYLYQTSGNENREGEIKARDRADAYAKLRKLGIRPYRVIGDDPPKWLAPLIWAGSVVAALALAGAIAWAVVMTLPPSPLPRQQIAGDRTVIDDGVYSGWIDVLPVMLDRLLAAYAQPGRIAIPPEVSEEDIAGFAEALKTDVVFVKGEREEHRFLKRILRRMRADMKEYLAMGGGVADYLVFLDQRQDEEHDFRERAVEAVLRAPESMRDKVLLGVNARLRDMAIEPVTLGGAAE